jgi:hypothetical protein
MTRSDPGAGIIGHGCTRYEKRPSRTEFAYLAEAARAALTSAGVHKSEVDGLHLSSSTIAPENAVTTAEHLGLSLSWAHVSTSASRGQLRLRRRHLAAVALMTRDLSALFRPRPARVAGVPARRPGEGA